MCRLESSTGAIGEQRRAITSKGTVQMGPLQAHTERWRDGSPAEPAGSPRAFRFARELDAEEQDGRHEPQSLIERIVPRDTYAAWLEQREAESERERERSPQIRWVHRPRGEDGRALIARRL